MPALSEIGSLTLWFVPISRWADTFGAVLSHSGLPCSRRCPTRDRYAESPGYYICRAFSTLSGLSNHHHLFYNDFKKL
ncbi:MAG: hypothetical protein JJU13_19305 [Balneolaceae bacterium]|nr:hypothetical protein [Balneolaceae bacterium]